MAVAPPARPPRDFDFDFDEAEKAAGFAFRHTPTDPVVLPAERWSDPFERP